VVDEIVFLEFYFFFLNNVPAADYLLVFDAFLGEFDLAVDLFEDLPVVVGLEGLGFFLFWLHGVI
jgi:hypothetical protein